MKITFWGAARQVTGSMHLLELPSGARVLIDCGLDYEKRKEFEERNANFPFDPKSIDLLILTHAHIDHSGNVPNLVRQGFNGKIVGTEPTLELSDFLLHDSLNIQRMEMAAKQKTIWKNSGKKFNKGKMPKVQTLYTKKHITEMLDQSVCLPYNVDYQYSDELTLSLHEAGHILGAASVRFSIKHNNKTTVVGFTGDLGNANSKLVPNPVPMKNLNYLISESTYGGRKHQSDSRNAEDAMLEEHKPLFSPSTNCIGPVDCQKFPFSQTVPWPSKAPRCTNTMWNSSMKKPLNFNKNMAHCSTSLCYKSLKMKKKVSF